MITTEKSKTKTHNLTKKKEEISPKTTKLKQKETQGRRNKDRAVPENKGVMETLTHLHHPQRPELTNEKAQSGGRVTEQNPAPISAPETHTEQRDGG